MKKKILGMVVWGSLGLVAACGSSSSSSPPVTTPAGCVDPTGAGCKIAVADGSFVKWTGPVIDAAAGGASSAVVSYAPGRLCLSGTVDAGANNTGWGAILIAGLADIDPTGKLVAPFNASALGVKQVRFNLESPPLQGVLPGITQLTSADCTQVPSCVTSFALGAPVTNPGSFTAKLSDFTQSDGTNANSSLDQTLITSLQLYVPVLPGMAVPYDFCIDDLAFLGADGKELKP